MVAIEKKIPGQLEILSWAVTNLPHIYGSYGST